MEREREEGGRKEGQKEEREAGRERKERRMEDPRPSILGEEMQRSHVPSRTRWWGQLGSHGRPYKLGEQK